jgi:hypothetical protein
MEAGWEGGADAGLEAGSVGATGLFFSGMTGHIDCGSVARLAAAGSVGRYN